MKMQLSEQGNSSKNNKKGSSTVFMAMVFVAFMAMILLSIGISRRLVVKSQINSFGRVWARAILSEYDIHLFEDYRLLAFKGSDSEVAEKLDRYARYSMNEKMKVKIDKTKVELGGYEMRDPDNFKKSLRKSLKAEAADTLLNGSNRKLRNVMHVEGEGKEASEGREEPKGNGRKIGNSVVLETLPSNGVKNTLNIDEAVRILKNNGLRDNLKEKGLNTAVELTFIHKYFGSHTKIADEKKAYFTNEWEYIIKGKPDDEANYLACRRRIFLIRNALNLSYLKGDKVKMALLSTAAEAITPGPFAIATKAVLMELWAALESENDVNELVRGGKVPIIKTPETWKTDLSLVLDGKNFAGTLNREAKDNLDKKKKEILKNDGAKGGECRGVGNDYEDYLIALMLLVNENTRVLRTMDLVQINMKYRYYEDFNFEEYYTGLCFATKINGYEYEIKDEYK